MNTSPTIVMFKQFVSVVILKQPKTFINKPSKRLIEIGKVKWNLHMLKEVKVMEMLRNRKMLKWLNELRIDKFKVVLKNINIITFSMFFQSESILIITSI
jgi:hypothetical protein